LSYKNYLKMKKTAFFDKTLSRTINLLKSDFIYNGNFRSTK